MVATIPSQPLGVMRQPLLSPNALSLSLKRLTLRPLSLGSNTTGSTLTGLSPETTASNRSSNNCLLTNHILTSINPRLSPNFDLDWAWSTILIDHRNTMFSHAHLLQCTDGGGGYLGRR